MYSRWDDETFLMMVQIHIDELGDMFLEIQKRNIDMDLLMPEMQGVYETLQGLEHEVQ